MTNENILEKTAKETGMSPFERFLRRLPVAVCSVFRDREGNLFPADFRETGAIISNPDTDRIAPQFPNTVAAHGNRVLRAVKPKRKGDGEAGRAVSGKRVLVLFSGGPAAGGNNVIVGLFKALGRGNQLYGVKAGPGGLLKGDTFEVTECDVRQIHNLGGFDFLGSDRTKIEDLKQFEKVKQVCRDQKIDAIVVIGGDDSNTNAAFLAEDLFSGVHEDGAGVQVIGVPKTIDGDLQVPGYLPISFGFDTATKIYSEMVGNIAQDTPSSRKYYHFIKIMGRSASHVALAVALKVRPSMTFISEEVAARGITVERIAEGIGYTIARRAERGIQHGIVIIPEGLIEFIPETRKLISELNSIIVSQAGSLTGKANDEKKAFISELLTPEARRTLESLPEEFRDMLLLDRDEHGNLPVSQIQTEKLLIQLTAEKIKDMQNHPEKYKFFKRFTPEEFAAFKKFKFAPLAHFLGYEGRCGAPSKFDMSYTLNLGLTAGSLILAGKTGYMASVNDLDSGGTPTAIPLTGLLTVERRGNREKIVIKKALVDLDAKSFQHLKSFRKYWALGDYFHSTGPRQYAGPRDVTDRMPLPIVLDNSYRSITYNLGRELVVFP